MYKRCFKRIFDIFGSLIFLPFLLMLILIVGIAIKIEDRGPIFYNAKRLGKNGIVFKMYKFRSMNVGAPDIRNKDGSTFNSEDDPRLTKVGKFVRKTSIDEIPQILNVLKGDMSFIGPRPDLPGAILEYNDIEVNKLKVRPGITGYSQAYYRNSIVSNEKFKNDVYYAFNLSLLFDIKIFLKTMVTILRRDKVFTDNNQNKVEND